MQRHTLTILIGALVLIAGGAMVAPQLFGDDDTPMVRWAADDEQEVVLAAEPADPATLGDDAARALERSQATTGGDGAADDRVEVLLRGRVVDKFRAPVAGATVWLDFGRGGPRGGGPGNRQRRVPDPVSTDADGRFAFQGQTFRNLRVSLQVAHDRHAPGVFDKDVGAVTAAVDLGDLVLMAGGEVRGRVTDLDGNGVSGAQVRLQPENDNQARQLRDRERMLPAATSDPNGFYRQAHVPAGDWSVAVTAKRHTEGRSGTFAVEEEQVADVEDVRLGPGFEVTGFVRDERGAPIAKATVVMRSEGRAGLGEGRGGPGGGGWQGFGGGREHRAVTDEQGRFFLEHLPGVPMRLDASADGYLDHRQSGIDTTLGQLVHVAMKDGLRIDGHVQSGGTPVTQFAFRAVRLRGLSVPGQAELDFTNAMAQLRDRAVDDATRDQVRAQFEGLRAQFTRGEQGRNGREARGQRPGAGPDEDRNERGGPGGGRARDLGRPGRHPNGDFTATGLQEGVYEVHVHSPGHARSRSAEVELRSGAATPRLTIELDEGVFVAGVVVDGSGAPIRGAQVELRQPSTFESLGRGRGRGRNGANGANAQPNEVAVDVAGMARELVRATAGMQATLETTTNAEGVFILKHASRGTWRLHAEAKGYASQASEPFELAGDRSGFELRLGALGSIAGTVRGLRPDDATNVRVAVLPYANPTGNDGPGLGALFRGNRGGGGDGGGGPFQNVGIGPDGSYRIDDLVPGDYLVRSWVGSTADFMREMAPRFTDGTLRADVTVRASDTVRFDPPLVRPQIGKVAGIVRHNGAPGAGFQVELSRIDANGGSAPAASPGRGRGPGGPGGPGAFGRTFQATVASSGTFTIANVPAGDYRLRVQNARRGGTLHEEVVAVAADATLERTIDVETASIDGTITADVGEDPKLLTGRVTLLPGLTQMPENYEVYVRENPRFDGQVRDGKFRFDSVKPGGYLLVFSGARRERTSMTIVVQGKQSIAVPAGKPRALPAPGGNEPRAPNGGAPRRGQPRGR
jgi:hypothetical protein